MRKKRPFIGIIVAFLIVAFSISPQMRSLYAMPERVLMFEEGGTVAELPYPLTIALSEECREVARISGESRSESSPHLVVRLFDFIPVKQIAVEQRPALKVMAGGHSIGVTMQMSGVLVVGFSTVTNASGEEREPARDAGVRIGDRIMTVNDTLITDDKDVADLVHHSGKLGQAVNIGIIRDGEEELVTCQPVFCAETQSYRIGLFVRDTALGIGTLTFCEPTTGRYGALGHVITDSDTNEEVVCASGSIMPASVSIVHHGMIGHPGEKIGVTWEGAESWGTITKNTRCGIYGTMSANIKNPFYPEALPIASRSQVREGQAQILTVVDGETIESFEIEIEKLRQQGSSVEKGMVLHVTDDSLLTRTGGIVQGMSGSPIIQDGKLVGAVTHVLVNDPTRGYGIFIENMIEEIE